MTSSLVYDKTTCLDDDFYEIIEITNHLINAIEIHENMISSIKERQQQLDKVANKLTDS